MVSFSVVGWEMVTVTFGERNKRGVVWLSRLGLWSLVKVANDGNGKGWPVEESLTNLGIELRFPLIQVFMRHLSVFRGVF